MSAIQAALDEGGRLGCGPGQGGRAGGQGVKDQRSVCRPAPAFKPYPAYKDSGVEWLGEIPARWEVKRLKRACASERRHAGRRATWSTGHDEIMVFGIAEGHERRRLESLDRGHDHCERVRETGDQAAFRPGGTCIVVRSRDLVQSMHGRDSTARE